MRAANWRVKVTRLVSGRPRFCRSLRVFLFAFISRASGLFFARGGGGAFSGRRCLVSSAFVVVCCCRRSCDVAVPLHRSGSLALCFRRVCAPREGPPCFRKSPRLRAAVAPPVCSAFTRPGWRSRTAGVRWDAQPLGCYRVPIRTPTTVSSRASRLTDIPALGFGQRPPSKLRAWDSCPGLPSLRAPDVCPLPGPRLCQLRHRHRSALEPRARVQYCTHAVSFPTVPAVSTHTHTWGLGAAVRTVPSTFAHWGPRPTMAHTAPAERALALRVVSHCLHVGHIPVGRGSTVGQVCRRRPRYPTPAVRQSLHVFCRQARLAIERQLAGGREVEVGV